MLVMLVHKTGMFPGSIPSPEDLNKGERKW